MPSRLQEVTVKAPDLGIDLKNPINLLNDRAWSDGLRILCRDGKITNERIGSINITGPFYGLLFEHFPYGRFYFVCVEKSGGPVYQGFLQAGTINADGTFTFAAGGLLNPIGDLIDTTNTTLEWCGDADFWSYQPFGYTEPAADNWAFFCANAKLWKHQHVAASEVVVPDLSAIATNVRCVRVYNRFVIVANLNEGGIYLPGRWRWSAYNNFDVWTPTLTNQAGYNDMERNEVIYALEMLRDKLFMYTNNGIYMITYVGYPSTWQLTPIVKGVGVCARKSVANCGDFHIFVSDTGNANIYMFDGISIAPIGEPIRDTYFAYQKALQFSSVATANKNPQVRTLVRPRNNEAWFFAPYIRTFNDGVTFTTVHTMFKDIFIYNWKSKSWSMTDLLHSSMVNRATPPEPCHDRIYCTSGVVSELIQHSYICTVDQKGSATYLIDVENKTGNTSTQKGYITSKLFDLGSSAVTKRLQRIRIEFNKAIAGTDIQVYIGTAENANQTISWSSAFNVSMASGGTVWLDVDITARYFAIKFSVDAEYTVGTQFEISEYAFYFILKSMV